jgi:hypothetical protein
MQHEKIRKQWDKTTVNSRPGTHVKNSERVEKKLLLIAGSAGEQNEFVIQCLHFNSC